MTRRTGWLLALTALGCAHLGPTPAVAPYDDARLWRVSWPAGGASYIYGTMHSADPRVLELPAAAIRAFEHADTFCMEILPDAAAMTAAAASLTYADGTTLGSVIDPGLYAAVRAALAERGLPEATTAQLRPWAAFLTLSAPPGGDGLPLDFALLQRAAQAEKDLCGAESPAQQIAVFSDMAADEQVALLREAVAHVDEQEPLYEQVTDAYARGDIRAVLRALDAQRPADAATRAIHDRFLIRLIDERNRAMAEALDPFLRRGGAFVAVGAAHLPGDRGMLALLGARGFRIERAAR